MSSDEICPCCGTQFGYDDLPNEHADQEQRWSELRRRWVADGQQWFSRSRRPPDDWDPNAQLPAAQRAAALLDGQGPASAVTKTAARQRGGSGAPQADAVGGPGGLYLRFLGYRARGGTVGWIADLALFFVSVAAFVVLAAVVAQGGNAVAAGTDPSSVFTSVLLLGIGVSAYVLYRSRRARP